MDIKKKYQVFISSAYLEMGEERQAAVQAVLTAGHIPAGMELFVAGDQSQLDVIKRWIKESDIYVLILGDRYGSIEPKSQLSYTEVEYDYAVSERKPHFALVLNDAAILRKRNRLGHKAEGAEKEAKLASFREKVLSKMSALVDDGKDIQINVPRSILDMEDRYELGGWIRSSESIDTQPLIAEISALTAQKQDLERQLKDAQSSTPMVPTSGGPLADLDAKTACHVTYYSGGTKSERVVQMSWKELFALIAPVIISPMSDSYMNSVVAQQVSKIADRTAGTASLLEQDFYTIRTQLVALGLIEISYAPTTAKTMANWWELTSRGKTLMMELRTVRQGIPTMPNTGSTGAS